MLEAAGALLIAGAKPCDAAAVLICFCDPPSGAEEEDGGDSSALVRAVAPAAETRLALQALFPEPRLQAALQQEQQQRALAPLVEAGPDAPPERVSVSDAEAILASGFAGTSLDFLLLRSATSSKALTVASSPVEEPSLRRFDDWAAAAPPRGSSGSVGDATTATSVLIRDHVRHRACAWFP